MRTRDVVVDGIRLHVAEAGDGPALLLLHGLSASGVNWEHTVPAFADRWRVVVPDLPGHGSSAKPDAPYTIDFFAGVIRSLGRTLGLRDAVIVGNSLGGQIAVEIGLQYPTWARALALIAPAGGFAGLLRAMSGAIGAAAAPAVLRVVLPRALDRCFHEPSGPGYTLRRHLLAERLAAPDFPEFARAVARSVAGALAAGNQPVGNLAQPALVLWGRNDRLLSPAGSRRFARELPHARVVELPECGHLPMLERPARFNEALAEFLRLVEAAPLPAARSQGGPP